MLRCMGEKQRKTELIKLALLRNFSGKTNQDFTGGRKTLPVSKYGAAINHVDPKAHLAGDSRHRHRHLTCAKDKEIRTVANDVDKHLDSGMLIPVDWLKCAIQRECLGNSFG